jgi:Flp pilus assembly protein TadD
LLGILVLILAGLFAVWKWWSRPAGNALTALSEDPRLTFATPYRNVRPEVKYVGDDGCVRCHQQQGQTYRDHPMGRSLAPVSSATPIERYDEAARNPFEALAFHYRVERHGERIVHRETARDAQRGLICEAEAEVHFAVGYGTRGRSYLINRDGYLFESPITWYSQKGVWDLSPGFDRLQLHFGRPVPTDCLFCHSNRVLEVADTENHYRPPLFEGYAIGCERCHGPGELHVRRQEAVEPYSGTDDTIVNPGRLEPVLREAVCEQCHLQGVVRVLKRGRQAFDFRPGLPLHLFLAVFVRPPAADEAQKFVGQVEQMHASRCFQGSNGQMGCISCHDPHVFPAAEERVAYYRDRCLRCHADRGCSVPLAARQQTSKDDSCAQCHMPASASDIPHSSITDHRIPRRVEAGPSPAASGGEEIPLRFFQQNLVAAGDREAARDLGVALMDRVERFPAAARRRFAELALPALEVAARAHPGDLPARDARAHALWALGNTSRAATAFDEVLAQSPQREVTLHWAAALALERKQPEAAIPYLERAREVNPWRHDVHVILAEAQVQRRDWPAAFREAQEALKLNPTSTEARQLLVEYYLEVGKPAEARAELDRLLGLHPPGEDALRRWFARRVPGG